VLMRRLKVHKETPPEPVGPPNSSDMHAQITSYTNKYRAPKFYRKSMHQTPGQEETVARARLALRSASERDLMQIENFRGEILRS
jgi:hypothetical protein